MPLEGRTEAWKTVLWSVHFPGGEVEGQPEVHVTWTRLDVPGVSFDNGGDATNAYTAEDGWFMIAGIDPDEPGCWEVTATYKGATLTYVYEVPSDGSPGSGTPPTTAPEAAGEATTTITAAPLVATFPYGGGLGFVVLDRASIDAYGEALGP